LGADGLRRVLDDLLDQNRLVRLANSCGLKYPGMRTRSQARERILGDLVKRAGEEQATRRAIVRTLQKETRTACRKWSALPADERAALLQDDEFLRSNGQLARHLFLLAASSSGEDQGALEGLLAWERRLREPRSADDPKRVSGKPKREETRLKRQLTALQKKMAHLEAQFAKSREAERTAKRDLIQRKGELAESRMLAERLREELKQAHEAALAVSAKKEPPAPRAESIEQMGKAIRRLAGEQKKLLRALEKQTDPPVPPVSAIEELLLPALAPLTELKRELAAMRRERKKELGGLVKRVEGLSSRLDEALAAPSASPKRAARGTQDRRGPERVGVFIDVQNMYYGARQLKGKLDFDALMQAAVRERRLIQATAYVVESKEIDQSGFIAILQKRAIEVRRKTVRVRADGSMKGDWDMELALDILDEAPGLDVVVLVSGDGDFTSLVQRVKRMGPRVEVIGFPRTTAKSLLEAADHFQPLNRKFMIDSNGSAARGKSAKAAAKKADPAAKPPAKTPS
jgi:uncharacterized LabA/DUF88 family protein